MKENVDICNRVDDNRNLNIYTLSISTLLTVLQKYNFVFELICTLIYKYINCIDVDIFFEHMQIDVNNDDAKQLVAFVKGALNSEGVYITHVKNLRVTSYPMLKT